MPDLLAVDVVVLQAAHHLVLRTRIDVFRQLRQTNPTDSRGDAGQVIVDHLRSETDGLEEPRAAIAVDGADAHLRHHALDRPVDRLEECGHRLGNGRIPTRRSTSFSAAVRA